MVNLTASQPTQCVTVPNCFRFTSVSSCFSIFALCQDAQGGIPQALPVNDPLLKTLWQNVRSVEGNVNVFCTLIL